MRNLGTALALSILACGGAQVQREPAPLPAEPRPVPVVQADSRELVREALAMLRSGDLRTGREKLSQAVAAGATDPVAYYNLAVADLKAGDPAAAEEHARKAVEYSKGAAKALALLTRVMVARERQELLVAYLQTLAEQLPESAEVRLALARAKAVGGRPAEALREAMEMLRKDEANTEVMKVIARAYLAMDRKDAARFVLGQVLEIRKDGEALDLLAHIALSEGQEAQATALFRQALEVDPGLADAHNNLGVLLQKAGDHAGAMREFEAAIAADPEYAAARVNMGNALRRGGDVGRAMEAYRDALRLDPNCAECHFNLGVAEMENRGAGPDEPSHYRRAMEHFRAYKGMRRAPKRDEEADKYYDEARRMAEKLEAEAARMKEAPPGPASGSESPPSEN